MPASTAVLPGRWRRKWQELNQHVQLTNYGQPSRTPGSSFRQANLRWQIATESARPHSHAWAVPEHIVQAVLRTRQEFNCCAEVVWHHVTVVLGLVVSLSSVRRILRRHHCFDGARKPRVRPNNPRRPLPTRPGELVQTDTIHHVDPCSGRRLYYYTVIDLYTRMAHVTVATRILPGLAASAVLEAEAKFGFSFSVVQADNVPEYGRYFLSRR